MAEDFTAETFEPHVQTTFRVADGPDVELLEVRKLDPGTDEHRAPFSLLFRGPDDKLLAQQTYQVGHDKLGKFDLFLVPLGPGVYEAVYG